QQRGEFGFGKMRQGLVQAVAGGGHFAQFQLHHGSGDDDPGVMRIFAKQAREALFGGTVFVATIFGMKRFDVTWWGKLATFLLMFAIPGLLIGASDLGAARGFNIAAWILAIPGLIISYATAVRYIPVIRTNLREGRAERNAAH
ncbi:MAG TPA: hypothetical protein PLV68_20920, partial [Ilumatobacteraceae bacterium]|nr:hypothetical protein [Ilumatobacteraceae bacterium]